MHTTLCRVSTASVLVLWSVPALAADTPTIADLAPAGSVFVAGVDNARAMFDAFDRTGFAEMWKDPQFQAWFSKHSKETLDEFTKGLGEMGIDEDDLKRPVGPVGIAAWFSGPAVVGDEPPAPPQVLMMADYADQAEAMHQTLVGAFEKSRDKQALTLVESTHEGTTIYTYAFVEKKDADEPGADDEFEMGGDPFGDAWSYKEMHYTKAGNVLLLSSDKEFLQDTIDRVTGGAGTGVGDDATFRSARTQLGDAQGYALVMGTSGRKWLNEVLEKVSEVAQAEGDPMPAMMGAMLGTLGLDKLDAAGLSFSFDSGGAMLEQNYVVLASAKEGLLGLFDTPATGFTPPAFIGPDAATLTYVQVNFPGILPLVNKIVAGLPEDMRAMVEGQVMMAQQMVGPALANLGPEMHVISRYERPLSPTSEQQVFAIKVRDQQAFSTAVQGIMPMLGMQARDFNGNQIYAPGEGGMIPPDSFAMGMGFGYVFMGPTAGVEDAMRSAGAEGAKLVDEARFKDAVRLTTGKGIGYAYSNADQTADWFEWYLQNIDRVIEQQVAASFGGGEPADDEERQWRDEAIKAAKEQIPEMLRDNPPAHLLRKHMGDSITEFRSTPEGFVGKSLVLKAK